MRNSLFAILAIVLSVSFITAEELSLPDLNVNYKLKVEDIKLKFLSGPIDNLNKMYLKRVEGLKSEYSQKGQLDAALAAEESVKVLPTESSIEKYTKFKTLSEIHKIYVDSKKKIEGIHNNEFLKVTKTYLSELEKMKLRLTKQQNLELAKIVQNKIKSVKENYYKKEHSVIEEPIDSNLIGKKGTYRDLAYEIKKDGIAITQAIKKIENIIIPSTIEGLPVTSIGERAFATSKSLTKVVISRSVIKIDNFAFAGCEELQTVSIPEGLLSSIGDNAFSACRKLTNITLPKSVNNIGSQAFGGCISLVNINLQEGIRTIGNQAFGYCHSLEEIDIPDSVTNIGGVFGNCRNLTKVNFGKNSQLNAMNRAFAVCPKLTSVTIPSGVTEFEGAFRECINLAKITIPKNVTKIGSSAFSGCTNLARITIPEKVSIIDMWAFRGCNKLTEITIPKNVSTLNNHAFAGCTNLARITFEKNSQLTKIGKGAFYYCNKLPEITIPEKVSIVGTGAFAGCKLLTAIRFLGDAPNAPSSEAINDPFSEDYSKAEIFGEGASPIIYRRPEAKGWSGAWSGRPVK